MNAASPKKITGGDMSKPGLNSMVTKSRQMRKTAA